MNKYQSGKIYIIKNSEDDMTYIGSTIRELRTRLRQHIRSATKLNSPNPVHEHMRKVGCEKFTIELIDTYPSNARSELEEEEMKYIKKIPNELLLNHKGNPKYDKPSFEDGLTPEQKAEFAERMARWTAKQEERDKLNKWYEQHYGVGKQ